MDVTIHPSWKEKLQDEFKKEYFGELVAKVKREYTQGPVFPQPQDIFRAFDLTPIDTIKVVIIGQDPYHTPGVADGLSFSTKPGNRVPPSLKNIYKEIIQEFNYDNYEYVNNPDLTRWATQGVLLLNNTLTVRSGQANSHAKFGWEEFTNNTIKLIAREKKQVVFMLWGRFAGGKAPLITEAAGENHSHLILTSAHPSPFSADKGFFGNNHFIKANEYLRKNGQEPINW